MNGDKKNDFGSPLGWGVVFSGVLAFAFLLIWLAAPPKIGIEGLAQIFGDVVGTAISSLALILLIFTVIQQQRALTIQREDLALTRQELKDTREELQRTADAQVASEKSLSEQARLAHTTARLNAMTTLLEYYRYLENTTSDSGRHGKAREMIDILSNKVLRLLNDLEEST